LAQSEAIKCFTSLFQIADLNPDVWHLSNGHQVRQIFTFTHSRL